MEITSTLIPFKFDYWLLCSTIKRKFKGYLNKPLKVAKSAHKV